ncbi:MAG: DUF1800 family protein, partial [Bryobacteraceae bacterium]
MRKWFAAALVFAGAFVLGARTTTPKKKSPAPDYSQFQKKLSKDERISHVLDRLTFGPRPGDVAAVKKIGLKKWIGLQLHPERIKENPELAKKLAPLKTLRMSPAEMVSSYPTPQMVRAIMQGRQPLPRDPILRTAVERMERRFKLKQTADNGDPLEPAIPLDQLLTPD